MRACCLTPAFVFISFPFFSLAEIVDHAIRSANHYSTLRAVSTSASNSFTDDEAFQNACVNSTNAIRSEHDARALKWNATLAAFGQNFSSRCEFRLPVRRSRSLRNRHSADNFCTGRSLRREYRGWPSRRCFINPTVDGTWPNDLFR